MSFAWPWAFILLPLPFILRLLLPACRTQQQAVLRVPFFQRIQQLTMLTKGYRFFHWRQIIYYLIWLLLVIALAGPQIIGQPIALPQKARNIMLAIDLSGSMQTPDYRVGNDMLTRLQVVKKIAGQFIKQRQGDRIGVVFFGTKAYLRTPITFDLNTVNYALQDASIGLAGQFTALGDGLGLAIKRLQAYPKQSRVIILLTDGANNQGSLSPAAAANIAKQQGIKVYTIGIGAEQLVYQTMFGQQTVNPSTDLDVKTLEQIAKISGGKFFRAKDTKALQQTYQAINQLEPSLTPKRMLQRMTPLYYWPLLAAWILSMLLLAWRVLSYYRWSSELQQAKE